MKNVLITGANRGIGLETALTFGREGYRVFATMRRPEEAHELKSVLQEEELAITLHPLDVDDDESVEKCFEEVYAEVDNLDILVNNAGIERHGAIENLDIEVFRQVMETNYFGLIRCVKAVLPRMRERRSGCIVNIASVAGHIANSPLAPYSASKFAVESFSEALAQEVKPFNIRVRIIEPGIINTDMAHDIQHGEPDENYPQVYRFGGLFTASLENPTGPELVAGTILEVSESDDWELRFPVGPDAIPFLDWRSSLTDQQWVDWNASDDKTWYKNVKESFGLDATVHVKEKEESEV